MNVLCECVVEVEMLATTLHSGEMPCVAGTLYPCVLPRPEAATAVSLCLSGFHEFVSIESNARHLNVPSKYNGSRSPCN